MKYLPVVLVFTISLVCAGAPPGFEHLENPIKECTASSPVQQNPLVRIWDSMSDGVSVQFGSFEKCFLLCLFQKDNYFNNDGNLRKGSEYVKHLLKTYPSMAKYSDVLMAQIFLTIRSAKSFTDIDKCETAYVTYHQLIQTIMMLRVARSIENVTHIKDRTINTVETGMGNNREISQKIEQYYKFFDDLLDDEAKWKSMKGNISSRPFCKVRKSLLTLEPSHNAISHAPSTTKC